jgi:hypothetical protein
MIGPLKVPLWIVISSPATLLVKFRVCPDTAPLIVEYSPAKLQVEIVTVVPPVLIVAVPNALLNVQFEKKAIEPNSFDLMVSVLRISGTVRAVVRFRLFKSTTGTEATADPWAGA